MTRCASSFSCMLSHVRLVALIAIGAGCAHHGTSAPSPFLANIDTTSVDDVSPYTADSAAVTVQKNCRIPLQAAMVRDSNGWYLSWEAIRAHVAMLPLNPHGEDNHLLLPQEPGARPVHASIRSIVGTETLTEEQSLRALLCGRVIARIESDGDHTPTKIRRGKNYLILARQQPVLNPRSKWIFIIVNPERQYRDTLPKFTYTPHYASNNAPWFSPKVYAFRHALGEKPISPKAQDCLARGFKACFIDVPESESHDGPFFAFPGFAARASQSELSEAWVSCPLYGCCCDGMGCHSS